MTTVVQVVGLRKVLHICRGARARKFHLVPYRGARGGDVITFPVAQVGLKKAGWSLAIQVESVILVLAFLF